MRLDLLGINVLAIAKNDHISAASSYKEIAARVKIAEVASVKPSILQNFGCRVETVVIALHHDGAANQNFTGAVFAVLRIGNADFSTRQRLAHRTEQVLSRGRQARR